MVAKVYQYLHRLIKFWSLLGGPRVPEALIEQLKIGGSLVMPVGDQENQKMIRVKKLDDNKLVTENFGSFKFVPLTGEQGWK